MRPLSIRAVLAALFALSLAVAIPVSGAGASAAADPAASSSAVFRGPDAPAATHGLTKAQVLAYSQHVNQRVLIVLKSQFRSMITHSRRSLRARSSVISTSQRNVLRELSQVRASRVHAFHLINAIGATVSRAELKHLQHDPGIAHVVPQQWLPGPRLQPLGQQAVGSAIRHLSTGQTCDKTPSLEPEALQLTHTAYSDKRKPQAQNRATGKGILIAYLADQLNPFNADFVRPDGTPVFVDYENFSGDGPGLNPNGGEAWLDATMMAAQGTQTYNLNNYLAPPWTGTKPCFNIKLLGMSPGASLMGLDVFGHINGAWDATILQGVEYAVFNGANIINESLGGYPTPIDNVDGLQMLNDAAVAAGVTVVASTGDQGYQAGVGTPASDPNIISAGASTSFRDVAQAELSGTSLGKGYNSDQMSAISSGSITQTGDKTPDVVAPGDATWILCQDCSGFAFATNNVSGPFGGTSESAPLVSGCAADVMQAFGDTHKDAKSHPIMPSPTQVKTIITSTADDLVGTPTSEEGHGRLNCLSAVQAAASWGKSIKYGHTLLTDPGTLSASGLPGAHVSMPFTVTNNGNRTQELTNYAAMLGPSSQVTGSPFTVQLDPTADKFFIDGAGRKRAYVMQRFAVPSGVDRLDASINWDYTSGPPGNLVRITLFDPNMKFSAWSWPLSSEGSGHVSIHQPMRGKWTALIWTAGSALGYKGAVNIDVTTAKRMTFGTVTPKRMTLAPGQTGNFTYQATLANTPGDASAQVLPIGKVSSAGALPVILRTMVPVSVGTPGSFGGSFMGGNDSQPIQVLNYTFNVPSGVNDVSASLSWADAHLNVTGVLVDPSGMTQDTQSTINTIDTDPNSPTYGQNLAYNNTLQFFHISPMAGVWRLTLVVSALSGKEIAEPFKGTIAFNTVDVTSSNVPNSTGTMLAAGTPVTATVHVHNTGNTTKSYFVDPRVSDYKQYYLGPQTAALPNVAHFGAWWVPPQTAQLIIAGESISPTVPIDMAVFPWNGGPEFLGSPGADIYGHYTDVATLTANDLTPGLWQATPEMVGPFGGPTSTTVDMGAVATTLEWGKGRGITADTGDLWAILTGASTEAYTPLVLAPGATGNITVTFNPTDNSGTVVAGNLYVNSFQATTNNFPYDPHSFSFTGEGGDQVAAIPYSYTVK
jgi:hypothetical protein